MVLQISEEKNKEKEKQKKEIERHMGSMLNSLRPGQSIFPTV